jgi:ribonuclease G
MKKILINQKPWETRVAIIRNNRLQNVYLSSDTSKYLERSFFKGVVTKVLPGIQTAFVDIGQEKAGFLHISEMDFSLALSRMDESLEIDDDINEKNEKSEKEVSAAPKRRSQSSLDMGKILTEGEVILVQVSKEPVYEKGAKLTRCFTLPGRFIVLMPNIARIGISKKIENPAERQQLKAELKALLPAGMGAIIRTSAGGHSIQEITKDVNYLVNTWYEIEASFKRAQNAQLLHEDLPVSLRTVRDNLDDQVELVITDSEENQKQLIKFVKEIAPEFLYKIKYYSGPPELFDFYNIESQINDALKRKVYLKSGGSIIIETAEAMTVIDVNTGKFIGKGNQEDTILKTNMEAAEEISRQLRLRNIGGLIVIDFIDLQNYSNKQKLLEHFEKSLKEHDRFQSVVLKISEFGLVQMTRKRSGKTLMRQLTQECPTCEGTGLIKSDQAICYKILRKLEDELLQIKNKKIINILLNPDIFHYLTSIEYNTILDLEKQTKTQITIVTNSNLDKHSYKIVVE